MNLVSMRLNFEMFFRDTYSLNKKYGFKGLSVIQNSASQRCAMEGQVSFYEKFYTAFEKRRYHGDCYCAYASREKMQVRSEYKWIRLSIR